MALSSNPAAGLLFAELVKDCCKVSSLLLAVAAAIFWALSFLLSGLLLKLAVARGVAAWAAAAARGEPWLPPESLSGGRACLQSMGIARGVGLVFAIPSVANLAESRFKRLAVSLDDRFALLLFALK